MAAESVTTPPILISYAGDRSNPQELQDATVVGEAAIFVGELPLAATYHKVSFYLDDPTRAAPPYSVDPSYPFDFNGTAPCPDGDVCTNPPAVMYDTVGLREGTHEVTVVVELTDGVVLHASATFLVEHPPGEPPHLYPDPAPSGVSTSVADSGEFLYTGDYPIQEGVAPGTIDEDRAAIVRGRLMAPDGSPLPNVMVTINAHPEYGWTRSRADGWFDMAVNGGEPLTVSLELDGHLSAQRQVLPQWQSWTVSEDAALIPYDDATTSVELSAIPSGDFAISRGSTVSGGDGLRTSTLLVPSGVTAELVFSDGSRQPLDSLSLRQTEFTVGQGGEAAMPAPLPPTSAFTYAVDLSTDEARASGAASTEFSKPLWHYNENFLGFPAGTAVPAGYYDYDRARWVPSDNGIVLQIVGTNGGLAEVDLTGDGVADGGEALIAIGMTDAERAELAELYAVGVSLWRVPISHFSPWDFNWGFGLPEDFIFPFFERLIQGLLASQLPNCTAVGSIIGCEGQTLGEQVALVGTSAGLAYSTHRVPGNRASSSLQALVTPASVPPSLKGVEVEVQVAGRRHVQSFPPAANTSFIYDWDGLDAYGRPVNGTQRASVTIRYLYDGAYERTARFADPGDGTRLTGNRTRRELVVSRTFSAELAASQVTDARDAGLGGWTLSAHHSYDPRSATLALGDGSVVHQRAIGSTVTTVAGNGTPGFAGDGGDAQQASLHFPGGVAFDAHGNLYVADTLNDRIRRVSTDGTMSTVAGTGTFGFGGDSGPATTADYASPLEITVGPDGAVYVADVDNHRIRRISPDGVVTTVAGSGVRGSGGDHGAATAAQLAEPTAVAVTADGTLYIAEFAGQRIRRVAPDGVITTVAGTGAKGFSGDGGPGRNARLNEPSSLAVDRDGNLYVADSGNHRVRRLGSDGTITTVAGTGRIGSSPDGTTAVQADLNTPVGVAIDIEGNLFISEQAGHRVRRVTPSGTIRTVAGTGSPGFKGDGGPSAGAALARPRAVAVAPEGSLAVVDAGNHRIRRIRPPRPTANLGTLLIPSPDASQVYEFDGDGRHLRTLDALTGIELLRFAYDSNGRLVSVTDPDGNSITISRPSTTQTEIRSPDGHTTTLTLNADGWTQAIASSGGNVHRATYTADGLLTAFTDANGNTSSYAYDPAGRLVSATGRDGKPTTLTRITLPDGQEVTVRTPMGRETVYRLTEAADGTIQRTVSDPTGLTQTERRRPDGTVELTVDGTTLTHTLAPDPRWGMTRPVPFTTTVQASGRPTVTATTNRTVTLATATDPLSVSNLTDKYTVGSRTWTTNYDAATRTITTTTPQGRRHVTTLDANGRIAQRQFASLASVSFGYDTRGRPTSATRGAGDEARTTTLTYDETGFLGGVTDALQRVTSYRYDLDGRPTEATGPAGTASFAYDANSNLTAITPPGRTAYGLTSAVDDRLAGYTVPDVDDQPDSYSYALNEDRQYTGGTLPSGTTVTSGYDAAGRLTTSTYGAAITSFGWGSDGRLATVTAPSGVSFNIGYTAGLPTSTTWNGPISGTVTVGYDDELRVSSETVAGTDAVAFKRDADGLLTDAGPVVLARDADSGMLTGTTVGVVGTGIDYSTFGEPARLTANASGNTVYDVRFTRDKLGRTAERVEVISGTTHSNAYDYDTAGRLTRVVRDGVEVASFGYDNAGNLTAETRDGVTTSATYDAQDRIVTFGARSYSHSADGERTSVSGSLPGSTTTYTWEGGRLVGATLPDGTTVAYALDGAGRRIAKSVNGTVTAGYLWSGSRLVAETDATGTITSRYVYASRAHVPDTIIRGATTYRIVSDERGSPRLVIDAATGDVAQRLDYDEWGRITADSNPGFQPFSFAGGLRDPHTGLLRFGARDYDPITARWLNRDPIGFSGGPNHYAYGDGDPINRIDPTGHSAIGCFNDILGLAGMLPVVGAYFDIANAALLAARGKWGDAGLALAAVVLPVSVNQLRGAARFGDAAQLAPQTGRSGTEIVERAMSRAELEATRFRGLVRGGREGTHYVSDAVNHDALRARQRLGLPQTPEVRVRMEVPEGVFSPPKRVDPALGMPGGGMERTATGPIPCRIICVWEY